MTTRHRCACTTAAAGSCAGDTTFDPPEPDGSCPCICHSEYEDAPEHWRPLSVDRYGDDLAAHEDLVARIEAAERLTGENDV